MNLISPYELEALKQIAAGFNAYSTIQTESPFSLTNKLLSKYLIKVAPKEITPFSCYMTYYQLTFSGQMVLAQSQK
jgi:hypothetical protein